MNTDEEKKADIEKAAEALLKAIDLVKKAGHFSMYGDFSCRNVCEELVLLVNRQGRSDLWSIAAVLDSFHSDGRIFKVLEDARISKGRMEVEQARRRAIEDAQYPITFGNHIRRF